MKKRLFIAATCLTATVSLMAQGGPTMGWSSWNTYGVNISDALIRRQADAMVSKGLKDVGYNHINIDDGFFGGRNTETGELIIHPTRFPNGLKPVADYIHSKGLKAGIYSDAGANTCGNMYNGDVLSVNVGLYNYDQHDADFYFKECGFDFIKVDFCGGDAPHTASGSRPAKTLHRHQQRHQSYRSKRCATERMPLGLSRHMGSRRGILLAHHPRHLGRLAISEGYSC